MWTLAPALAAAAIALPLLTLLGTALVYSTTHHVPHVITSSVVIWSLLVTVADWWFSQLWLLRI